MDIRREYVRHAVDKPAVLIYGHYELAQVIDDDAFELFCQFDQEDTGQLVSWISEGKTGRYRTVRCLRRDEEVDD